MQVLAKVLHVLVLLRLLPFSAKQDIPFPGSYLLSAVSPRHSALIVQDFSICPGTVS